MPADRLTAAALAACVLVSVSTAAPAARAAPGHCPGEDALAALVDAHESRYPAWTVQDALKLLQQSATGSEHWVRDGEAAAWMRSEWATLGPGPAEPLVDTLGPGGQFARVHLRPYKAAGGDPDRLVRAFVATAQLAPSDTAALACALAALSDLAHRGALPWSADSVDAAARAWREAGYPALHHSDRFAARYRPAYRVVAVALVPGLLAGLHRDDRSGH